MTKPTVRLEPLTGMASVLLLLLALLLEGTPPAADVATAEVVRYYAENQTRLLIGTLVASLSAALLLWFGGSVHTTLRAGDGKTGHLGVIAFGGFVVASVGHCMLFGFVLAGAETVRAVSPETTQTLGVLAALLIVPLAVGMAVAMLATAIAIVRHAALPQWLGHVTLVITLAATASSGFGAYVAVMGWVVASMIWTVLVSVVISLRPQTKLEASDYARS